MTVEDVWIPTGVYPCENRGGNDTASVVSFSEDPNSNKKGRIFNPALYLL